MVSRRVLVAVRQVALRATGLLAVLVGLCAMHGLAGDGAMASADGGAMPHSAAQVAGGMGAVDAIRDPGVVLGFMSGEDGSPAAGNPGDEGMSMSAIGLCVTVLVLTVGAVALWVRRCGWRRLRWAWPLPRGVVSSHGRAPDPPSLLVLSVCRC
jgi:hypothetical protein